MYGSHADPIADIAWRSVTCSGCGVRKDGDFWTLGKTIPPDAYETAAKAWNTRATP